MSLGYNYREKPRAVPLHCPVFSLYCLSWKAKGSVRDPITSKRQRQGCSGNLHPKFPEFREINITVVTFISTLVYFFVHTEDGPGKCIVPKRKDTLLGK